jgi:hypothetical protein
MKEIPSAPGHFADENGDIWHGDRKLNSYAGKDGYVSVALRNGMWSANTQVHRLVCEAYHGSRPQGHQCRHLNGVRHDNQPHNLAWGTPMENTDDKRRHGTLHRGGRKKKPLVLPPINDGRRYRRKGQRMPQVQINFKISEADKAILVRLAELERKSLTDAMLGAVRSALDGKIGVGVVRATIPSLDSEISAPSTCYLPNRTVGNQVVDDFAFSEILIDRAAV